MKKICKLCTLISLILVPVFLHASAIDNQSGKKSSVKDSQSSGDTLVVLARLAEIPGKFPPNDLYNYVYIMKYRVVKVIKGKYTERDILVGHYNPLVPRKLIKDRMSPIVKGNVVKFEVNARHLLTLIKPIEDVWKDAVEDDYSDSDQDKYFALKTDMAK
jgi:hypothetical protein